jgi:dienelactone hydrolase
MGDLIGIRVSYQDEEQPLEGYLAACASASNLPGVLVMPTWLNVDESLCRRADRLAELGYAVFVADLFGVGVRPRPPQLPLTVATPFLEDRLQFRRRLFVGLRALNVGRNVTLTAWRQLDTVLEAVVFSSWRVPVLPCAG